MPPKNTLPDVYFDNRKSCYWLKLEKPVRFLSLDSRNVKLHLRRAQFKVDPEDDWGLKAGDNLLVVAQIENSVDYAGPLAGHKAGPFKAQDGSRVLVTSDVQPVAAEKGDPEHLEKFLTQLFGSEQLPFVMYWLKVARESLLTGDFRPGQMLCLAGPSACGKSLFQSLVTEFLGGRMAKPYRYMTGDTQFNHDLAAAEHLVIADEQASVSIGARREFGAKVKDLTVNLEMSVHAKGRDAVTLPTFRRLTLSVNDEPENLMILPPLDDSILDKVMLFKCTPAKVGKDRLRVWKTFTRELPALAYYLEKLRIPEKWQDDRFGVKAYHNPDLLQIVTGLSPELRLLDLIDEVLFTKRQGESHEEFAERLEEGFEGTAVELEKSLRTSAFQFAVEKLLHFSSACGVYLARLASKMPDRFQQTKNKGRTLWKIRKGAEQ